MVIGANEASCGAEDVGTSSGGVETDVPEELTDGGTGCGLIVSRKFSGSSSANPRPVVFINVLDGSI